MGHFNLKRRAELKEALTARQRELNDKFPAIERPCGTPGAVYSIVVEGQTLAIGVTLPFEIDSALPPEAAETMKKSLHDAVLPIVEQFYRDVWAKTISGKTIDGPEPMPKKWGLLFEKWIRRCWQRGTWPQGIPSANSDRWPAQNWYMLPDEYKWDHPSRSDCEGWQ